jgi:hypothetical protein
VRARAGAPAIALALGLALGSPAFAQSAPEAALADAARFTGLAEPSADAAAGALLAEGYAAAGKADLRTAAHRIAWALLRGGLASDQARTARLSLSDEMSQMGRPEVAAALLAPLAADPAFDVQSRRAFSLQGAGRTAEAAEAFALAAAAAPDRDNRVLMTRGRIFALDKLGQPAATLAAVREAAAREALQGRDAVDLAYVALKNKDDALALSLFAAADRSGELKDMAALDAGYTARRAGDEKTAARYFRKGLATAVRRANDPAQAQSLYGIRREVEALSRRWGAYASMFYDNSRGEAAAAPGAGRGNLQVGGEVFWRPLGYHGGRPVEVFFRTFETLDSRSGDPTGAQTAQGWVGVRAKVLAEQNLVVEGSRMLKLGSRATNDWMVRASYSATSGLDLKADRAAWPFGHIFVDGARLVDSGETFATVDARAGWAFEFGGVRRGAIVAPFAGATLSYDSGLQQETAVGAGPGVWVRQWFRGSDDEAPRSYVDLLLQYRLRLSGGKRAEGLFTSISLSY